MMPAMGEALSDNTAPGGSGSIQQGDARSFTKEAATLRAHGERRQRWSLSEISIMVVQAGTLVVLLMQNCTMKGQLNVAIEALRAKPAIVKYDGAATGDGRSTFTIWLVNNGPSPAQFRAYLRPEVIRANTPAPKPETVPTPVKPFDGVVANGSLEFRYTGPTLTSADMEAVQSGVSRLYLTGKVQFDDDLGKPKWQQFCRVLD